jgi:hypothetical protein
MPRGRRVAPAFPIVPEDAIEFVRVVFAEANCRVTGALSRQPSMHEEALDLQLIATLDEVGPRLLPGSRAAVEIETHWLGGRRHFGSWEIADIALVVMVRRTGRLLVRKVALLQSKRLYSKEIAVTELERIDYMIGIGRLIDRTDPLLTLTVPRNFMFTGDCVYGAVTAGSEQVKRIDEYQRQHQLPVYYNLYNPPDVPFYGVVPRLLTDDVDKTPNLGCRILTSTQAHSALSNLPFGKTPSFSELSTNPPSGVAEQYANHGWRLETFIADEVLQCREGQVFTDRQDSRLQALLSGRTAPIASAIVMTIDLPSD